MSPANGRSLYPEWKQTRLSRATVFDASRALPPPEPAASGPQHGKATSARPEFDIPGAGYMQFDNLFIAGCGTWLPEPMTVQAAQEAGLCDRKLIWRTQVASVCVAGDESPPEMAALAAEPALRQA